MDGKMYADSLRNSKRTIRMNTNRREDLSMEQELVDVNKKTIIDISVKKQLKEQEEPTEDEMYFRNMAPEFMPQPPKRERKSVPVYHENMKSKEFKSDQYLVMPTIPAYSPVDVGPKVVLDSRSRKYPYVHKKLTTTEEMKKPRVSTLGVIPVRSSCEIPNLKVFLEGAPAPIDDNESMAVPKLYNTPATSFFAPKLVLEQLTSQDENQTAKGIIKETERTNEDGEHVEFVEDYKEEVQKKPAILAGEGTSTTVKFCERSKPASKPSYLYSHRRRAARKAIIRPDTAESFQSSLMSGEITLPDAAVYSRYDDAINQIDEDKDVETAVGMADKTERSRGSLPSRESSVKSVQELVEEAKRISSAGSQPLYLQRTDSAGRKVIVEPGAKNKVTVEVTDTTKGRKALKPSRSAKSTRSERKSARDGKTKERKKSVAKQDEGEEAVRGERTVDEIIASLRDQSAYNVETEADRKIKEIMNRVMSRTNAVLGSDFEDKEGDADTAEGDMLAASSDQQTLAVELDLSSRSPSNASDAYELMEDSPRGIVDTGTASDIFREAMKGPGVHDHIAEESDGEGLSLTTRTTETLRTTVGDDAEPIDEDGLHPEDDEDEDHTLMPWEIQQAWEDLLAPPEATAEDILYVHGDMKDLQGKKMLAPDTGPKRNVIGPSVSFLSSWAPSGAKRAEPVVKPGRHFSNNIHHFCTMTQEYQLPTSLVHAGRKYHAPDRFPSVMPEQPYRFKPGEPQVPEQEASSTSSSTRVGRAAERVVAEAHRTLEASTLTEWQQKADYMLGETDMALEGSQVEVRTDESQVYWNPAPPKLGAAPHKVRELLFPLYEVEELDEYGQLKAPPPGDEESDSSEEEDLEEMSPEDKAAIERTILKRHNSAETLTTFSRERTEVSLDKKGNEAEFTDDEGDADDEGRSERADEDAKDVESVAAPDVAYPVIEGRLQPLFDETMESQSVKFEAEEKPVAPKRPMTAPNMLANNDTTLIVPQDFNTAMYEISEQRRLLEKAKKQLRVQDAFDELEKIEAEEEKEKEVLLPATETYDVLTVSEPPKPVEEELTPAEKALQAGRNYVILPKKKQKKRNQQAMDLAKIEAVEKFLTLKPSVKLERHDSMPKLNRIIERELRVPWQIRHHRSSIPDLLNFEEYKTRKRMPHSVAGVKILVGEGNPCCPPYLAGATGIRPTDNEREWVRGIWNNWFDQVFPPTPEGSEGEDEGEDQGEVTEQNKDEKKKMKKDTIDDILSQDIEAIDPIVDTPENAEIYQILLEEIEKLSEVINVMFNPTAFDYCRRGALYRKIGQLRKAEMDLDRAISLESDLLDAYWHRHLLYILQDRKSAALDDLNFIMKKNKSHAGAYRSMAEIYKRQNDITMAVINYSSAIKSNPLDHEAYYQRAQLYEERGEMLLAMEDYTKAMRIMPSRTDAIMKHGMYYFENENWQNAINDFTELMKVDPLNSTAKLYRGRAYAKMNNWVPAVEDLSAAIHLDPYNWQAFYQRACILRKAHPKRALQDYSVSLLLNDSEENVMSYLHRGILYNTLGKSEDSIPDFESVLKLNKEIAAAHVNLGLIYMTKHLNYHRAIKKFTSAIKVDPTYVRGYVCRAEAYHKIHETKNALKDFTRAIHLKPDTHHYYMFRGKLVLELGNLDLAAFCVRHASELGMDSPTSTFGGSPTQQAVVQSFLKNYDKAVDALQQASRVKPIAPYFMLLGKTHMKAKQFKDAVSSFKSALEKMRPWKKRDPWPAEAADAHYLSGLCHMELRSYSEALLQFNYAIKFNPQYADAYYQRGLAAVKMRQMKGIQDFNRALALNPKIFQAYLSRACYYGMKGKFAKAILNCNEAIKLKPKSVRAYLYRGSLKYHIKAYDLAILDLTKASAIDTQCPLPYFNRAVCYHENFQYDKALTDYGIVLLLGDMLGLKVLINRGLLYFEKQDYMNALYDFQAAAKLSASDHRIHHTLGLCFHKLNRLKEAVTTFTQCLQLKPFFLDGLIARGNVFMDYGHERGLEFARRDYQRALRLDPLCLPARINLGYTAQVAGKLMQAWKHFSAVIEVRPNYKPALEGRAIINLQMSNTFAAFQDISQSINYGATAELLTNRGVINQFMGDRVMAMQDYQRAIKLDPAYSLAYFNAGNIYFHTRHFKQALNYYIKAKELNPKDESAFLNCAITKVLLHDSQGALADFKVAVKLSPYSAHIYFNRANLYASLQQYDKAEKEYTQALTLKPDDALMLKRRADVRGKLGKQAEAIQDYKRAVDIQTRPNKLVAS